MTDATKAKVWDAYVEPFGTATVFGTPSAGLDLRLPGQFTQAETGALSQNWSRDYDTSLGRYIEADPLGIDAGQSVYGYVDGDPLNRRDPAGLRPITASDWRRIGAISLAEEAVGLGPEDPFADVAVALTDLVMMAKILSEVTPKSIWGGRDAQCPERKECELMYRRETEICNRLVYEYGRDGPRIAAICHETATARYSECRVGGFENVKTPLYVGPARNRR